MEMRYLQEVSTERQNHYWYGGDLIEIIYNDNITFIISAIGDVIGDIYDKDNNYIVHFKDKRNNGVLESTLYSYTDIKTDEQLEIAIIDSVDSKNSCNSEHKILFDYNNWFELSVIVNGQWYDLVWALDSDRLASAIEEAIEDIPELIEHINKTILNNKKEEEI